MRPPQPRIERRKAARETVAINAFVHCRGRFHNAKITDFSAGGVRLAGTFGLHTSDPVEIELISGTRIAGRVIWSVGGRTGITFSEPLDEKHPAIIELAYAAAVKAR
jgi:PilZ domain